MSKQQKPTAEPISEIMQQATMAAFNLRSARHSYNQAYQDILTRLDRARQDIEDSARYGETMGSKAGDIVTALDRIASNMRPDLLVKYAAQIDTAERVLAVYMNHLLVEDEKARIEQILSI